MIYRYNITAYYSVELPKPIEHYSDKQIMEYCDNSNLKEVNEEWVGLINE